MLFILPNRLTYVHPCTPVIPLVPSDSPTLNLLSALYKQTDIWTTPRLPVATARVPPVASLPTLGPWAPPAERGPSLESIYRVSLTVDLCEGNKIISFKNLFHHSQSGAPQKENKSGGPGHLGTCPVCPLVKTALRSLLGM